MRYGVFSDVHSNLEALKAVLFAMAEEKVERYICLGDSVSYAAQPNECLTLIRQLPLTTVAGNHDLSAIGDPIMEWLNEPARISAEWSGSQLTEEHKTWIRTLTLVTQEQSATLVHGSLVEPEKFNYLFNFSEISANFALMQTPLCFVGHSHFPWIVEEGDRFAVREISYERGKKYLINVGSVGQPRDGDNRASFCIWDSQLHRIELKRICYDIETAQKKIKAAGLPLRFAERLAVGR